MKEQYQVNDQSDNGFLGKYIDIRLADDATLEKQLDTFGSTQIYVNADNEDELPYPTRSIMLESWQGAEPDTRIVGDVLFRPTDLENAPGTWQKGFRKQLAESIEEYNYLVADLPHDPSAIYISLDPDHTIRAELRSTSIECAITISLESTLIVENATHLALPLPYSDKTLSKLELLRHTTTVLGIAIDQLRDTYGNVPRYHSKRYVINQWNETNAPTPEVELFGMPHSSELEGVSHEELGLQAVGGATHAKERLAEIAAIIQQPEIATLYGVERTHFLLHGPPGTGKTSLVRAFAQEIDAIVQSVSSSDLVEMWVGKSGRNVTEIFRNAKKTSEKLILFFDEFDALAGKGRTGSSERIDIRKLLNQELEDVAKNYPLITVAAATNADLDDLEPSLIRSGRIEPISVPLPNEDERFDIFGTIFMKSVVAFNKNTELQFDGDGVEIPGNAFTPYDNSIDIRLLAQMADGMTGADFEIILARARKKHFMHYQRTGEMKQVSQEDISREIHDFGR